MALLDLRFFSQTLGESSSLTVIAPEGGVNDTQARLTGESAGVGTNGAMPVLYLLHGLEGDDSVWTRRTLIERYVGELGLLVVMPKVGRSFYCDEAYGQKYWTFLTTELPEMISRMFNVSTAREDTFVAGLSMGGYGAFKWALREPHRFAAAASLSGALNVAGSESFDRLREQVPQVWGDKGPEGTPDDLIHLLASAHPAELPALYQRCGTEDFLFADNQAFAAAAKAAGVTVDSDLAHPGDHNWDYWNEQIQGVLGWLPISSEISSR